MRKEYFLGEPRKRRASLVWIDNWIEGDETGTYYDAKVFYGRRMSPSFCNPDYAIKLGHALIKAGERARQLQDNRDRRGRKYLRYRKKPRPEA